MRTHFLLLLWAMLCHHGDARAFFRRATGDALKGTTGTAAGDGAVLRRSKRGWMWNHFFLLEEYTGTDYQYVGKLHSDQDRGDGSVKYVLSGDGAGSLFLIDENSGDIHATKRLDREEKAYYTLRAQAVNKFTNRPLEPESEFIIKIHDINDNEPKFTKDVYSASVPEMAEVGTYVVQVTATDADDPTYGNSARLVYSILQGQPYFSVDPETGIIKTALANMNRENREHFQVVIQAKDMAGQMGGLSGTTTVNITLSDVNDNPPRFPQGVYQFSTPESTEPGSPVGRIKATDADVGINAEMDYAIISGDGVDTFDIVTDSTTQEGVITVKKPLNYERKATYVLKIQVENTNKDLRFSSLGPFKDTATVKIAVEDVDEPPVFEQDSYTMEVKEDAAIGTAIASVSAADPDTSRSLIRYSIDRRTDMDRLFNVNPGNGTIFTLKPLDREEAAWHNLSVIATEFSMMLYLQRIQTVSASDVDEPKGGHRFYFSLAPEASVKANFTVKDNRDCSPVAGAHSEPSVPYSPNRTCIILTGGCGTYLVPVVISDGEHPVQSSTNTLTVRVCSCDRDGNMKVCNAEAYTLSAGLSTGALVAILLCVIILLMIVVLFAALRRQKKKEPLIISKEDVRDNVVSYNDEGGGEEDTQAFDIGTLRNPEAVDDSKQRRDIIPESLYPPVRRAPAIAQSRDNADVRDFINQRLQENDADPTAPPYDSLATYAYEGNGSVAESLSSLDSVTTDGDQDYNYLSDWGPRFKKLADMYGGEDSDRDS
ncbi:hypothetical protein JZ751_028628 [Albula glossodonta]|uniref:Cadherin-10 n=1 Tax=Albula glossodonta TaxID=121402 RepID=A0A8T2NIN5_9TELE|nr:hypothetical protein JZ751_028628 [Albula glossodonta]